MTDQERKNRIVARAAECFPRLGPSGVTMEEIARGVGMGKATVYRLFPSKEALAEAAVDFIAARIEENIQSALQRAEAPEERLEGFLSAVSGALSGVQAEAMRDAARTMPAIYEKIERERQRVIGQNLTGLIRAGKAEGAFRDDLDERLATHVLIGSLNQLTRPDVLETLNCRPNELLRALLNQLAAGWRA